MQHSITIAQARTLLTSNQAILIDVREPNERTIGVVTQAQLLPISVMQARIHEVPNDHSILLICRTHNRSEKMMPVLRTNG